ncbi:MAG: D-alanyl-D-alanine carboxypeptidase/D-alanyl-D-alanine-endopeptidase, partial [Flavobacteriales bacterium]|nr:D-alanyl-D-alanine carboxypeptidase/D-alanyl-D-alanine-endopeptidase [Flavobacteriales bacterium]
MNRDKILKSKTAWIFLITFATLLNAVISWNGNGNFKEKVKAKIAEKISADTLVLANSDLPELKAINEYLEALGIAPEMKHATWGFTLAPVNKDVMYVNHGGKKTLVPASIMKTVTTSAALAILKPYYRFKTELKYHGILNSIDRSYTGNIHIKGGGDPTLGSKIFHSTRPDSTMERWYQAIKRLGIDTIKGSIIGDGEDFEFDMIPNSWAWEDMQSGYCAGASGLSFKENIFAFVVNASIDTVFFERYTDVPEFELVNNLKVGDKDTPAAIWISSSPYMSKCYIYGQVSSDSSRFGLECQVPDPPFLCAYTFDKFLRKKGIVISNPPSTKRRQRMEPVKRVESFSIMNYLAPVTFYTNYSPALIDIINFTNMHSNNFFAESILKQIGYKVLNYGSNVNGFDVIRSHWLRDGINIKGLNQFDGSGLSRFDAVSTDFMVEMLKSTAKEKHFDMFYNSLPSAGETGTLRNMCKGTLAEGNVHAKSGTMTRVKSYSGYVTTKSGEMLAFAMISNNHTCSAAAMKKHYENLMV